MFMERARAHCVSHTHHVHGHTPTGGAGCLQIPRSVGAREEPEYCVCCASLGEIDKTPTKAGGVYRGMSRSDGLVMWGHISPSPALEAIARAYVLFAVTISERASVLR